MKFLKAALISYLILVVASLSYATDYYVSTQGSDSNNGLSQGAAFLTCDKAATVATKPGDNVLFVNDGAHTAHSGTYYCDIRSQGTAANPITFKALTPPNKAAGQWNATIDGGYTVDAGFMLWESVKYVKIEGLEVKRFKKDGIMIRGSRNDGGTPIFVENVTIKDNIIHHIADNAVVADCNDGFGRSAVFSDQWTNNITLDGNTIHTIGRKYNTACTINQTAHDHGWYAQGRKQWAVNNIFYNCFAGAAIKVDGYCSPLAYNADDIPVGEWTHKMSNNSFSYGTNPVGNGHLMINNNATAACVYGTDGTRSRFITPHDVIVENNIFHKPPLSPTAAIRFYYSNYFKRTVLRNNVSTANLYRFYNTYVYGPEDGSSISVNANNTANHSESGIFADVSSMSNPDFSLVAGFVGIDGGYNNELAIDYAGNARVAPIDVGAYEYGAAYPDLKPPTLLFIDDVAQTSNGLDTVSASWGDATVKKWEYNSTGACSSTVGDYSKTDTDGMNQSDTVNNGKWICLYGEDAAANKATLASAYPINVVQNHPLIYVGPDDAYGAKVDIDAAGAEWIF